MYSSDFDGLFLYPSAMSAISILIGESKILESDHLNYDFLKKQDAYIVTIHFTKLNKHRTFPLIPQRINEGVEWNVDVSPNFAITLNNIMLEDLTEFQEIEFEVLRGLYWNEGLE